MHNNNEKLPMGCVPSRVYAIVQSVQSANDDDPPEHLMQTIDHKMGVNCIEISEDRSLLVTGGEDCKARLYSTMSSPCECIGVLEGHQSYISCCAVHKHMVITGSADHTIRVWEIESGECIATLSGHQSVVNHVMCEERYIMSTSYDKTARVWSLYNNNDEYCVQLLDGHDKAVTQIAMVPTDELMFRNGQIHPMDVLVTTSIDSTVRTWSLETGECLKVLEGHKGAVNCLALDPQDRRHAYTGGADGLIKCWDLITGDLLTDLKGHEDTVLCLLTHKRILYSGSADRTARAWAIEFGECTRIYYRNTSSVTCVQYWDGILYTGGSDCAARLYDANSGTLKRTCEGHSNAVSALKVAPGRMFTGSYDGKICVWDCSGIVADTVFGGKRVEPERDPTSEFEDSTNVRNAVRRLEPFIRTYR